MKKFLCAAFAATGTLLFAAENVSYTWSLNNAEGVRGWQKEAPTAEKPLTFKKAPKAPWGPRMVVKLDKAEPGVFYRFRFDSKTENPKGSYFCRHQTLGYIFGDAPSNRGSSTFFVQTDSAAHNLWEVGFEQDFGKLTVNSLVVEKLTADELYKNVIPDDGIEPGFWRKFWGGTKDIVGVVKEVETSPNGKVLAFPETNGGHIAAMPFPFLPNRKFELSFWLRSDKQVPLSFQVLSSNLKATRIGLKNEWVEHKYTGITNDKMTHGGLILMFIVGGKNPFPAFELGGIDFHYVK